MKTVLIIILALIIIASYLVISGKKQREKYEENKKLLTVENYMLIKNSPYADKLSKLTIWREESKLRFTSQSGGSLFFLELEDGEPNTIKLRGLDGYGIRDREFLNYTANLIRKIIEKNNDSGVH
ncbi:MAG: hypothetical protein L3J14_01750 [Flavobacteriaceae bacterium]|nr:hypothetical protein [Flavobacteriaceae bacterium]